MINASIATTAIIARGTTTPMTALEPVERPGFEGTEADVTAGVEEVDIDVGLIPDAVGLSVAFQFI